jgi:hypothetical protein
LRIVDCNTRCVMTTSLLRELTAQRTRRRAGEKPEALERRNTVECTEPFVLEARWTPSPRGTARSATAIATASVTVDDAKSKSALQNRKFDPHALLSFADRQRNLPQSARARDHRRSKRSTVAHRRAAIADLSRAPRAAEKFGVRFFDNSCTLCLTVSFSHP